MNYTRLLLATLAATVAYFAYGFLAFAMSPLTDEFRKYPAVYRTQEDMKAVMPVGLLATFGAILVVAILYAKIHRGGSGLAEGAQLGALIGVFAVCGFVLHNYVNLNIGLRLTIGQAIAYFIEWMIVGVVIGLIYKT